MKDPAFITEMVSKGLHAKEKASKFSELTAGQLNWKSSEEKWSVGQCLDHLIVSDCSYFPQFEEIVSGTHEMTFWEKWNPFNGLWGKVMVTQVQEKPKRKLKAPKVIRPTQSNVAPEIYQRFQKHLDSLLDYIRDCHDTDIDRLHITSPVSRFITYSLRNAIQLLMQHEHRHLNQAMAVILEGAFPTIHD